MRVRVLCSSVRASRHSRPPARRLTRSGPLRVRPPARALLARAAAARRAGAAAHLRRHAAPAAARAVRVPGARVRRRAPRTARLCGGAPTHARLASRSLGTAMAFAALQEGVFKCARSAREAAAAAAALVVSRNALTPCASPAARARRIDGFRFGGWMTFITSAWFCVCAALELLLSGDTQRKGAWRVRARDACARHGAAAACARSRLSGVRCCSLPVAPCAGLLRAGVADHQRHVPHQLVRAGACSWWW